MPPPKPPSIPRPSASLVLLNAQSEVLLVERRSNASTFSGMHVFPGGGAEQSESIATTALRELWEESGVILARRTDTSKPLSLESLQKTRKDMYDGQKTFDAACEEHGLAPDRDALMPFTRWITPANVPRRFDTHFLVYMLPKEIDPILHTPTPDSAEEVVSFKWLTPLAALAAQKNRTMRFMPPQFYLINVLARIFTTGGTRTSEQEELLRSVCSGPFGQRVFNPESERMDGRNVLSFEGDELRGGQPGDRNRALVVFGKPGLVDEIDIEVNIDQALFGRDASRLSHYAASRL